MKIYKISNDYIGEAEIENTLEEMQVAIGGYIEIVRLFENYILVCNEEGKIKQKEPTLMLMFPNGEEFIAGTCFICKDNGEEFEGLTKEEIKVFKDYKPLNILRILQVR